MRTTRALRRALISCAVVVIAGSSCNSRFHAGPGSPAHAAFEGVPVGGGELRLVKRIHHVVDGESREVVGFPLVHTAVTAKVAGALAVYEIEQTFANPFDEPIEAVYVFPLGNKAAISGYAITIGERTIAGEIQQRDDARRTYERARSDGHTAALVEQDKANIFSQRVANIAPREEIRVKLTVADLLDYEAGAYELVVPLVIGPRYLPSEHADRRPAPAMTHVHPIEASSNVSFAAEIDSGVPIRSITSPSHELVVRDVSPTRSVVGFADPGELPNRDLIVRFATAGPQTEVGVLAHRTGDDGFFVLTVHPKAEYRDTDIAGREVMLVIDRSGSMRGEPLDQAKTVASMILESLGERDSFNILGFASGVEIMSSELVRGDPAGKQRGRNYLAAMHAGGGTEMERGVMAMLTADPGDRVRVIYFLTDGWIGNDDTVVAAARTTLGANRIITVGIGAAPNRHLLDRVAAVGRGYASYVSTSDPPEHIGRALVLRSSRPYLTDVSIDWGGLEVSDVLPERIPDVFAGQPLVLAGRYRKPGRGTVIVNATVAGRPISIPVAVELPAQRTLEPVASLWARRRIDARTMAISCPSEHAMRDRGCQVPEGAREEITALGLRFHLLTEETSFVAVDRTRVVSNGQMRVVNQPAIIPEGTHQEAAPPPPPPPRRESRSSYSYDDGNSGGLFSGGPEHRPRALVALAAMFLLAGAWWISRRRRLYLK